MFPESKKDQKGLSPHADRQPLGGILRWMGDCERGNSKRDSRDEAPAGGHMLVSAHSSRRLRFLGFASLSILAILFASCNDNRDEGDKTGTSVQGSGSYPTLDARGGDFDSEVSTGVRTLPATNGGYGGAGGTIQIFSESGSVRASPSAGSGPPALGFPDPLDPTTSLDVLSGQVLTVSGHQAYEWLRVRAGGTLRIAGNAILEVTQGVEISGKLESMVSESSLHAGNLRIVAGGSVVIQGKIVANGFSRDERHAGRPELYSGGNGGNVSIASAGGGVYIGPAGAILADGGDTNALSWTFWGMDPIAGCGGTVSIESAGTVVIEGRISARGGEAYATGAGGEGNGGTISIAAQGDIEFYNAHEFNVDGGSSSDAAAGNGGSISIEASSTVDLESFALQALGGNATYFATTAAGTGGSVYVSGSTVRMSDVGINVSGGKALKRGSAPTSSGASIAYLGGVGGAGGSIEIEATSRLYLGDGVANELPVELRAAGGRSTTPGTGGAQGGAIKLKGTSNFYFDGTAQVSGGSAETGPHGDLGTICADGASDSVRLKIGGASGLIPEDCT